MRKTIAIFFILFYHFNCYNLYAQINTTTNPTYINLFKLDKFYLEKKLNYVGFAEKSYFYYNLKYSYGFRRELNIPTIKILAQNNCLVCEKINDVIPFKVTHPLKIGKYEPDLFCNIMWAGLGAFIGYAVGYSKERSYAGPCALIGATIGFGVGIRKCNYTFD